MPDQRPHWPAVLAALALVAAGLTLAVGTPPSLAEGNESLGGPEVYRKLAAGGTHTCAIVNAGRVKCWGANGSGRLGLGDTLARADAAGEMGDALRSVDLGFGRTATAIAAGNAHTCALLDNGQVRCWGDNTSGRLGLGDTSARGDAAGEMGDALSPVGLGAGRTATAITAGNNHTCALLDNATVKCWGNNAAGQLGLGNTLARGDAANEMGNNLPAVALGTGRTAVAVTAGNAHTCALLDNATVKCWGDNASGRLGLGNTADRGDAGGEMGNNLPAVDLGSGRTATAITAGDAHTCAVLDNASVKCWGENTAGRLGLGNTADRGDDANEMGDNLPVVSLGAGRIATGLSAGDAHTCALLDNQTVKCWGENDFGRLGLGDTTDRGDAANEMGNNLPAVSLGTGRTATAVTTGAMHTCATLDNGTRKCWGRNTLGQLGLGDTADRGDAAGEMGNSLPAIALGARRTALMISAGQAHTCAVLDNGSVKCWGGASAGRLGLGDTTDRGDQAGQMGDNLPAVDLGTGRRATSVSAGYAHTCALLDNGSVKCWGANSFGQLGLGHTSDRGDNPGEMGDQLPAVSLGTGRTATAVDTGFNHSCALLDNGTVKCWGTNFRGQLGQGAVENIGWGAGQMGDNLPAIPLGAGRTATAMAAGFEHTCALLDNATVKCWGRNHDGQLGLGTTANRGDADGEMGDSLPVVSLDPARTVTAITAGGHNTCAIDNNAVKCWGANAAGQLGQGVTWNIGDHPNEMGIFLPAVSLGTGRSPAMVESAGDHTCAVLDDGSTKCWGSSFFGELGLGTTATLGDNAGEMGNSLPAVDLGTGRTARLVTGGGARTCAVLDDASAKCWGAGWLGIESATIRGDEPGEMGDNLPVVNLGSGAPTGVSGTVTDAVSGAPVAGAFVAALRTTDFSMAAGAIANAAGHFSAELPAGTYFLYAIDPTGRHVAGFFGSPTTRTVGSVGLVDADPALAPTRGTVAGKVVDAATGDPVPGAWALALSGTTGAPETATQGDASGIYTLGDLTAGNHYLAFLDPGGNHATRFYPGSPDVPNATPLAVTAGATTEANGELPAQAGTGTGAALTGQVVDKNNAPLAQVLVLAMHASDFRLARAAPTNSAGQYTLDVAAGSYKLVFLDTTGRHFMEWHDNQPSDQIANAANVTAPAVTNATLDATTGTITGTLTDQTSGAPLGGAWAFAISATGTVTGTVTNPNGTYTITGLPPGTYRATYADPVGGRAQEYFNDSPTYDGGTNINVTAGATTPDINAALAKP